MKKSVIVAALLLLVAGLQTAWAQRIVVTTMDNQVVKFDVSNIKEVSFEEAVVHEWVDLGLPSHTLWAKCNVGANSPEECGNYFAWGETTPKDNYSWITYKYSMGSFQTLTKYCYQSDYGYNGFRDNLKELLPVDDAATANWGSGWQMPSVAQQVELINTEYTTTAWTIQNGMYGRLITSNSNGNSIFLPATGYYEYREDMSTSLRDVGGGHYWSRSLDGSDSAHDLRFASGGFGCSSYYRECGLCVRPVRK